jgi:phage anti-repressor protein
MEIIRIEKTAGMETANARELHEFLQAKSRYNDWISNRIKKYQFVEGKDFITITKSLVNGGSQKEHHLSIDMAKELSMVENNDRGRQARQYFIQCEAALKTGQYLTIKDIPMIVSETIKAIIPLIREMRTPALPMPDKYQRIGDIVANRAMEKDARKKRHDAVQPDLFKGNGK